jgi:K+-transporting ATPase KdpF subunit
MKGSREFSNARRPHAAVHGDLLRRGLSLCQGLPQIEVTMHIDWITAIGLALSVLLMAYLVVALLFPEKF